MKKIRFLITAAVMVLALIGGPLLSGPLPSTAAQKPIPQECVDSCSRLLYECFSQGEKENRCISVYRSCIAKCKH